MFTPAQLLQNQVQAAALAETLIDELLSEQSVLQTPVVFLEAFKKTYLSHSGKVSLLKSRNRFHARKLLYLPGCMPGDVSFLCF